MPRPGASSPHAGVSLMTAALAVCLLLAAPGPERFAAVDSWTGEFEGTYDYDAEIATGEGSASDHHHRKLISGKIELSNDAEIATGEGSASDHRKLISGKIELSKRTEKLWGSWRGTATARLSVARKVVTPTRLGVFVMEREADAQRTGTAVLEMDLREPGRHEYWLQIRLPDIATEDVFTGPRGSRRSPANVNFRNTGQLILHGTLPAEGMTLHGVRTISLYGPEVENVEWTLKPTEPLKAVAVVAPVDRGTESLLDGSGSKGKIKRWTWTVEPICPRGKRYTTEGKTVRVLLLCKSNVKLRVEDGSASDETKDPVLADVRPRRWETEPTLAEPIYADDLSPLVVLWAHLGQDRCGIEKVANTGHKIHHLVDSTWKVKGAGDGYTLEQAHGGPFDGIFYVATQKLKMNRMPVMNVDLAPGSLLDQANTSMGTGKAFSRLSDQARAHEKMHGILIAEELKKADPTRDFEGKIDANEEALTETVDRIIGLAETRLNEATTDAHVKERLRQDPRFACSNPPAYVFLRDPKDPGAPRPSKLGPNDVGRFTSSCYADLGDEVSANPKSVP